MQRATSKEALTNALESNEHVLVFKHSTQCPISAQAHKQTQQFSTQHPDLCVLRVDVIEQRALSNYVEEQTGVKHESPQALLIRAEEVIWSASHRAITVDALKKAWNSVKNA